MPSAIFSHQAPGLVLKIRYPDKFDGTALCISTFIPDITAIIDFFLPFTLRGISHSFLGLIYYTVSLTLLLTLLFRKYFLPYMSQVAKKEGILSKPLNYLGIGVWDKLKNKKYDRKSLAVAIYSAYIGGFTHLLLDLPSHGYIEFFFPWVIFRSPEILLYSVWQWQNYNITIYELIWIIESLITLALAVYSLRYIKKNNLISKWYNET
ncbi:MAG: DUF4184 family protein [Promethearchaeota archaeon]|jgi:hypothetical protein